MIPEGEVSARVNGPSSGSIKISVGIIFMNGSQAIITMFSMCPFTVGGWLATTSKIIVFGTPAFIESEHITSIG